MQRFTLAVATLFFAAAASAGDFRFNYSPQNLATPEEVAKLHVKLEAATNSYCRSQYITLNVHETQKCSQNLMEQTVKQIGNARLADLQESHVEQRG